jgi:hypothetical protein
MRCSACGAPYQEATGQRLSAQTRLCSACNRAWLAWLDENLDWRWRGLKFYDHAASSIGAQPTRMAFAPVVLKERSHRCEG